MKVENFTPLPEDLQGWNSNSPIFKDLVEEVKPKVIIEVGSWKGASAIQMAKAAQALGLNTKLYCIDTWLGSLEFRENEEYFGGNSWGRMLLHGYPQVYYQFLSNIIHQGVVEMIEPVPSISRDAAPFVPQADLIYLDGNHYYEAVLEDLRTFWPKLRPGGIMFGDDYYLTTRTGRKDGYVAGVERAVKDFCKEIGRPEWPQIVRFNNFWILKK